MRNTTEQNITALATERFSACPDARLREVVTSLVKHLHGFIRDVEPTEAEWMAGIQFLTSVGKMCDDKRQEFILMSDVLGVSILVDAINHRLPDAATPSTVVGPFHIHDSPDFDNGANMAGGAPGTPLVLTGTVRSLGRHADSERRRRRLAARRRRCLRGAEAGAGGRLSARRLSHRQGRPLRRADRRADRLHHSARRSGWPARDGTGVSPYRPTHVHFDVSADGFSSVVTHIFRNGVDHLDDDVVFAVKDRLIVDFVEHKPGVAPNGERIDVPYCTANFDFILAPVRQPVGVR